MATLNVAVSTSFVGLEISEACLKKIRAVSPAIKVTDASVLLAEEQNGDLTHKAEYDALLKNAEVLFVDFRLPKDVLRRAPHLKWLQVMSAGVEMLLDEDMIKSPVALTNASGLAAIPIAEWILMAMLMFAKQMPRYYKLQEEHKWERYDSAVLRDKTIGIIGLGDIGTETARLAQSFGMKVIGCRRSQRRSRYCDTMVSRENLPELLEASDYVLIAVPWTPETARMVSVKELAAMKPTAVIINIGRGDIIDEPALIRALENKQIAGAYLDVFSHEPLPPSSPLWGMPNVIMTPHVSGSMEDYVGQACNLFVKNLTRYVAGKRLFNVVDKKRGY